MISLGCMVKDGETFHPKPSLDAAAAPVPASDRQAPLFEPFLFSGEIVLDSASEISERLDKFMPNPLNMMMHPRVHKNLYCAWNHDESKVMTGGRLP